MSPVSNSSMGIYFDQILLNIKENISKDIRYTCSDCGRLKSRDAELSGTLCPSCESSNLSLDPTLNKFTTLVKNIQFDIENKPTDRDVFLRPSLNTNGLNSKENLTSDSPGKISGNRLINVCNKSNQSTQTDVSFRPFDNVSFVVNKDMNDSNGRMRHLEPIESGEEIIKADESCSLSIQMKSQKPKEIEEIIKEDKKCLPSIQMESQNHLDKCEGGQQNPTHNHQQEADFADSHETNFSLNEDNTTANVDKILTKSQEQFIETETEVIESSVNDLLLPKRNSSSPLLFSQETKDVEMGEPSDDECVNATPPREFESTCTWRKEKEVSKSVAVISSDEEMTIDKESTQWNDEKEINKTDKDPKDTNIHLQENEPMQTDTLLDKTTMDELENKQTESNNCPADFEFQETSSQTNDKTCIEPDPNLIEEQLLTQNTQKLSKHNLKIVISNIEGDDYVHLERFIDVFNPLIDNDVNQQTNFLIVGVDSENKVLRRTPKFLKAISLHVCIVNVDYVRQCCEEGDIVTLARKFIPLDSSGLNGPIKSYLYQTSSLLDNFVFYSMEEDEYLRSLLEFIIIHNGGVIIADHKLFKAYRGARTQGGTTQGDGFKKVILYGETQAGTMTEANKMKLFTLYACHCVDYKVLFNCVASYDTVELGIA